MPVIVEIIIFFIILFGFFGVSWLWHRAWFGNNGLEANPQPAAAPGGASAFKLFTAGLVTVFLVGLYWIIFALLN